MAAHDAAGAVELGLFLVGLAVGFLAAFLLCCWLQSLDDADHAEHDRIMAANEDFARRMVNKNARRRGEAGRKVG